jgi:hypothetical protein
VSLTDPTLPRKLRQARRPSTVRVVVILAILVIGGVGIGYGWTGISLIGEYGEPSALVIAGIVAGMPLTILGGIIWSATVLRRADIGLGYGAAATLVGAGAGVVLAGQTIIGGVLLAVGVVFLILGLTAARARRSQEVRDVETMRSGTLVMATVSDKGYDFFRESARILTTVTFTFTDLQGAQRWVQKPMVIHQATPVVDGQETRLWFDALHPDDTTRIVIELARENRMRS